MEQCTAVDFYLLVIHLLCKGMSYLQVWAYEYGLFSSYPVFETKHIFLQMSCYNQTGFQKENVKDNLMFFHSELNSITEDSHLKPLSTLFHDKVQPMLAVRTNYILLFVGALGVLGSCSGISIIC